MTRNRVLPIALVASLALTGCQGLKDALTAHADTIARAGSSTLTVARLSDLIAKNPQIPGDTAVVRLLADAWVNYHLLAAASANGDSLNSPADIDDAMWMFLGSAKAQRLFDQVAAQAGPPDTVITEAIYNQGDQLSAAHILFLVPAGAAQNVVDSIKRVAEGVRARTNSANFGAMAARYSEDPGSKDEGGLYPIFPRGGMDPDFENGVLALRPGQISPLIQSQYGFHIIRRPLLAEVKSEWVAARKASHVTVANSTYVAGLEANGKVDVKSSAIKTIKDVVADLETHRDDKRVLATSVAGNFTVGQFVRYVDAAYPAPNRPDVLAQMKEAPDSQLTPFLRGMVRNELIMHRADSLKLMPDSAALADIRAQFSEAILSAWQELGVAPDQLADSAKTRDERLRIADGRIEARLDAMIDDPQLFVQVPEQVADVLRKKYDNSIFDAGVTRTVQQIAKVRAEAAANFGGGGPGSAIPMPGAAPPAGSAPPPEAAPPQTK